ncbi:DNA replication and repair protein RadC [Methanosarcina thermophila]|uniref:DNA replication and repair protein RadC n=3 Tax=Methanosarcina thermophila TaxID=2210 RepID=A0A1I6Z855_METTE|nr:DNA repair protein RadC [Methanosarcina thermophila]ALK06420.1 MAG: DNA repair protein RadC [Methanosarcina sp. 795]AKB11929.1 DNA repair protein RadC [Methanosarcina thermophila TM-1]AKB14874.1 DNA repair protein RadC [Methanosarcina thermophila CHTI-55]NLU55930.1 DNA repair protein RadC [Methanosarcina thermophila]SFT58611.1 DNA replication and repair protein RadC [Methanosarcina thermophila]
MAISKIRIRDIPEEERPRERLIRNGPESLSNAELLGVILRTGSREENAVSLANQILSKYNIKQLSLTNVSTLTQVHGVGKAKAAQIAAVFELARRLETFVEEPKRKICSPKDVYVLMYPKMREQKKEKFITLCLDTKNQVLKEEVVSIGSLNASIVHPREVFKSALMESSASVIIVHNHPSGDPSPSREDIMVTEKLVEGGKLLGIDVLDHIIIGDGRYVSLKDEGFVK